MYSSVRINYICDGFSAFTCSNETLPWDAVDGFSKERCSLRYFRILIQSKKVLVTFLGLEGMPERRFISGNLPMALGSLRVKIFYRENP